MLIDLVRPTEEHYQFLRDAYPWGWGTPELFRWKHQEDPYAGRDLAELRDDTGLIGVIVGRGYPCQVAGRAASALWFTDFAVRADRRGQGLMERMMATVPEDGRFLGQLGTASSETYNRYYRSVPCLARLQEVALRGASPRAHERVREPEAICQALNANASSLYVLRTAEYLRWIGACPRYQEVLFLGDSAQVVGIGLTEEVAEVIELSSTDTGVLQWAVGAAAAYRPTVKIAIPHGEQPTVLPGSPTLLRESYITCRPCNELGRRLLAAPGRIWVPKVDRK